MFLWHLCSATSSHDTSRLTLSPRDVCCTTVCPLHTTVPYLRFASKESVISTPVLMASHQHSCLSDIRHLHFGSTSHHTTVLPAGELRLRIVLCALSSTVRLLLCLHSLSSTFSPFSPSRLQPPSFHCLHSIVNPSVLVDFALIFSSSLSAFVVVPSCNLIHFHSPTNHHYHCCCCSYHPNVCLVIIKAFLLLVVLQVCKV